MIALRVHVSDLIVGDRIVTDTYNSYGLHLISANTLVNSEEITLLMRHHVDYVEIEDRFQKNESAANDRKSSNPLQAAQPRYDEATHGVKQLFEQVMAEGRIEESTVQNTFEPLVDNFNQEKDVVSLLLSLNNKDDYTYQHSVQVGMLSYYIAKWLNKSESEALFIGKAGYLHDIGKSKIDEAILKKPSKLTQEEYEEIKKHTPYGFDILMQSFGDRQLAQTALQHHERCNGKGYPHGVTASRIDPVAKIVAVADVYSAMISDRVYQHKRDLLYVLRELHRISFGELDPYIVHIFIRNMIPNFIGKKVLLTNGESGKIIMTNPTDYFRPLIKAGETFLDLSRQRHLEIETIYM